MNADEIRKAETVIVNCKGVSNEAGGVDVTITCTVPECVFPFFKATIDEALKSFAERLNAPYVYVDNLKPGGGATA
jgi:hypothetical protein